MRRSLIAGLVAAAVLLVPATAWAHVTVDPGEAPKGGTDQEITLRIPNEDESASTVKVDVKIPTDHPLLGIEVEAKPGWTFEVKTTKLATPITTDDGTITEAVSEIIWSGGTIPPGAYGDFRFIVGQLPDDTDQLELKTIQTYDGGKEVSWIEDPAAEGQPEPEFPAPVLTLVSGTGGSTTATTTAGSTPEVSSSAATSDDVDSAKKIALAGVAIGAIALIAGIGALVLSKRKADE
jgi:uncharacterized protein YcnI